MEDPALNTQIVETKELQTRWRQFSDFVELAHSGKPIKPEADMKFMELKCRIAMLHDSFMDSLEHDQSTGQNMMELLNNCVTLPRLVEATDADRKKFKFDWNECYILLTEQISHLQEERERLLGVNERSYRAAQSRSAMRAKIYNFFTGPGFKSFIYLGIFLAVVWIVPAYVWSYREFGKMGWSKKIYTPVSNNFYRKYADKEWAYNNMAEVDFIPSATSEAIWVVEAGKPIGDYKAEVEKYFPTPGAAAALNATLDKTMTADGFTSNYVHGKIANNPAEGQFYFLMFNTTKDAQDYADAMAAAYKALTPEQKAGIDNTFRPIRKANLIAVGISGHPLRTGYINEKMGYPADPPTFLK